MNRKQFLVVLLALAIVGGAGLVLIKRNQQSWAIHEVKVGDKVLPNFKINDVATIHVRGSADFNVVRTNGLWRVRERNDYPAEFGLISDLLLKIRDLKVVQSDIIGSSQRGRLGLNVPGAQTNCGTLIEFKDRQGNVLAALLAGKRHARPQNDSEPLGIHGFFDGRYVLLPSDPQNVLLISDELAAAGPDPGSWLKKDFFKVENVKLVSLMSTNPAECWEISRESEKAPWTLANVSSGERLDPKAAADISEILAFPTFDDVVPKSAAPAEVGLEKPTVVTVMTDDLAYTLKVGARGPDGNRPMTVSVAASIPTERPVAAGERPEDKERLDQEFRERNNRLREKVSREQALASWVFAVNTWIDLVVRDRSRLLEKKGVTSDQTAQR